jgi:acetylornithine deacetylase/succinyl-diaminopimelate desuccinylase-like protein
LAATGQPHGRVLVLIEGSEESGSPHLAPYLDHLSARIGRPDLVICLDSGCATYDRLWVTTSLRGLVNATLRVAVLSEGVHSGHAGGVVPSSFRIARQLLSRIEDEHNGTVLLAAATTTIPPHRRAEIAAVAAEIGEGAAGEFPTLDGLELAGDEVAERIERGTWRPALSVIGADGLPRVADAGNVLLPETILKLSLRLPPNADAAAAAAALRDALLAEPPSGAHVSVEIDAPADGWDSPEQQPWLAGAVESASLARFGAPARSLGLGGSIPFMATLGERFPGTQFLATGVLGPQSNAHGPNEFLHVPTAKAISCAVADVLAATR